MIQRRSVAAVVSDVFRNVFVALGVFLLVVLVTVAFFALAAGEWLIDKFYGKTAA